MAEKLIIDERLIYEVLSVVDEIPLGKIATYGQIARLIGREKNTRLVGKILRISQQYGEYPCHRVVNHIGRTAPGWFKQPIFLRQEGVPLKENGCVDLRKYQPDQVKVVYSHVNRIVVLGIMPVSKAVPIDQGIDVWANFGTNFFLERREADVFNLGGPGSITVDGTRYEMGFEDCLYITVGAKEVIFASNSPEEPARFYLVSAPAHRSYETRLLKFTDANKRPCGAEETSNKRVINRFIHPDVLPTCQLSMGLT